MTDAERIARLELVLGTLIAWLRRELGDADTGKLLQRLQSDRPLDGNKL